MKVNQITLNFTEMLRENSSKRSEEAKTVEKKQR